MRQHDTSLKRAQTLAWQGETDAATHGGDTDITREIYQSSFWRDPLFRRITSAPAESMESQRRKSMSGYRGSRQTKARRCVMTSGPFHSQRTMS